MIETQRSHSTKPGHIEQTFVRHFDKPIRVPVDEPTPVFVLSYYGSGNIIYIGCLLPK